MNYVVGRVWYNVGTGYSYREDEPGHVRRTDAPKSPATLHRVSASEMAVHYHLVDYGEYHIVEEPW